MGEIFLSRVNDCIESMAIFTAWAKINSVKYFCNARVAGSGEIFVQRKVLAVWYVYWEVIVCCFTDVLFCFGDCMFLFLFFSLYSQPRGLHCNYDWRYMTDWLCQTNKILVTIPYLSFHHNYC